MARQIASRRGYLRRPGVNTAAEMLGCTYSHLRRVLTGERQSKSLLARYNSLGPESGERVGEDTEPPAKPKAAQKRKPPGINFAATQNLSPHFFEVLSKLGFNIVLVQFKAEFNSPLWAFPKIVDASELDAALKSAKAGSYDSSAHDVGVVAHFFHATKLGETVRILKTCLESHSLLGITTIYHAETNGSLRIWFPGTAKEIAL